jgi:Coenzyme PQQ synthesis protein D (PqqD)
VRYRVNTPQVISETVGGETIIVNLASGHYFNLQDTAVDVWEALERGEASQSIVISLEQRYAAADGEIQAAVQELLDGFVAAELVVADGNGVVDVQLASPPTAGDRPPFTAPSFTTFTDMQDIILLDPVHEVDARGWPHAPAGA